MHTHARDCTWHSKREYFINCHRRSCALSPRHSCFKMPPAVIIILLFLPSLFFINNLIFKKNAQIHSNKILKLTCYGTNAFLGICLTCQHVSSSGVSLAAHLNHTHSPLRFIFLKKYIYKEKYQDEIQTFLGRVLHCIIRADGCRQFLRRVPIPGRVERVPGLPRFVRVSVHGS